MASTSAQEPTTEGSGPARRSGVSRAGQSSPSAPCSSPADAGGWVADGLRERIRPTGATPGGGHSRPLSAPSPRGGAAARVPEPPPPLEPPDPLEPDDEPEPDEQPDRPVPPEREPLPV